MKTTAVIPAHNESMNITDVVSGCKKYVDSVIVVDDGSKDNTATLAEKAGATVVKHLQNGGYGRALTYGIKNAMELGADVIITIDGDGQHNPAEIPKFLKAFELFNTDIVSGSRFLGNFIASQTHRRLGIKLLTMLPYLLCGLHMSDIQCGFRAYKRRVFEEINPTDFGMGFSVEVPIRAKGKGFTFIEVPVAVKYNKEVKLSGSFKHGSSVLYAIMKHWWDTFILQKYG